MPTNLSLFTVAQHDQDLLSMIWSLFDYSVFRNSLQVKSQQKKIFEEPSESELLLQDLS